MEKTSIDLAGIAKFAVGLAVKKAEEITELPLGNLFNPLVEEGVKKLGLRMMEIDPITLALGKVMIAGMDRQRKLEQARRDDASRVG